MLKQTTDRQGPRDILHSNENDYPLLAPFLEKMINDHLPGAAITTFINYYRQLRSGYRGLIFEQEIVPATPEEISGIDELVSLKQAGEHVLQHTVIIKLNGGLGTTMGCNGPKSLITVKNGYSFIEIIIKNVLHLRRSRSILLPLILMDSFNTEGPSREMLARYPELESGIPQSFQQHRFPKVLCSSLTPAVYPENPRLEWNPPGHGDIYNSLLTSGVLDMLLARGFKYAFVSNIDNLGAELDTGILGYMETSSIDFLMEVADRTITDRKGGHIGFLNDGTPVLREAAQCPENEMEYFQDIKRHRYFNTNNIWINLVTLKEVIEKNESALDLPMICNRKNLNPLDPKSPEVFQLESAMGSALSVFPSSRCLRVPRTRFLPVKTGEDLLLLWSDYCRLTEDFRIMTDEANGRPHPLVELDRNFYSTVDNLFERFPQGAPSLRECLSLKVTGDVVFGGDVSIVGSVAIHNRTGGPCHIPDHSRIAQDLVIDS